MANMVMMASSNPLITASTTTTTTKPKLQITNTTLKNLKANKPNITIPLPTPSKLIKTLTLVTPIVTFAAPSMAVEMEKAALFDFNLTLPIIMVEFLLLMVALDKLFFTPLGDFMDKRDREIKERLGSVKDTSEEVKQLEEQAAAIMKAARAEISAALNKMKKETQAEVEQKLIEGRRKVEVELQEALAALDKQKEDTIRSLDSQIAALSDEIVKKVLPAP